MMNSRRNRQICSCYMLHFGSLFFCIFFCIFCFFAIGRGVLGLGFWIVNRDCCFYLLADESK